MLDNILPHISVASLGLNAFVVPVLATGTGTTKDTVLVAESPLDVAENTASDHVKTPTVSEIEDLATPASKFNLDAIHIQSSPYADPLNHLNLEELDQPLRLFALALTEFQSTRPDYATAPYMSSFNWQEVFEILRDLCAEVGIQWKRLDFYVVIFRSKLQAKADRTRLSELDQMSHQEACASGGLLHYWFGSPDVERRNLATCIWRNRQDAAAGGKGPWHRKARGAAREMYESITFHTHKLVVDDGALSWQLEEYHG